MALALGRVLAQVLVDGHPRDAHRPRNLRHGRRCRAGRALARSWRAAVPRPPRPRPPAGRATAPAGDIAAFLVHLVRRRPRLFACRCVVPATPRRRPSGAPWHGRRFPKRRPSCRPGASGRRPGSRRVRRPAPLGVGPGAVAGDDLDARVRPQPGGQVCARPIGEQVDGAVAGEIDEDRAIGQPLGMAQSSTPRTVSTGRSTSGSRRMSRRAYRADRKPELARQPRALRPIGEGDGGERFPLAISAPGVGVGDAHQPLGEDLPRAGGVGAEELADDDPQAYDQRRPGQIDQGAGVPAVNAVGELAAQRARHGGRCGGSQEGQPSPSSRSVATWSDGGTRRQAGTTRHLLRRSGPDGEDCPRSQHAASTGSPNPREEPTLAHVHRGRQPPEPRDQTSISRG